MFLVDMQCRISERLQLLYKGIMDMKERGLPVDAIKPQGAIYLSLHINLIGKGHFHTNEDIRNWLLEKASVAVVPFQAFDMKEESGWFRMSIGAANIEELSSALTRIEFAFHNISF
jgi:aspartate aminotransferase